MPGINSAADSTEVPFDPFELKDVVGGSIRDPYPLLHELRRQSPVHSGPIDVGEGAATADPTKPPPVTVLGFDEVVQVLRDNGTYSSAVYADVTEVVMGRTILQMDEPEHRIIRALVASSFRSKMLERWEEQLVAVVVNELIDSFVGSGRSDLVRSVTFNFPVQVIARILGLPRRTTRGSNAGRSSSPALPPTGSGAWRRPRRCASTSRASWRSDGPVRATISSVTSSGQRSRGSG